MKWAPVLYERGIPWTTIFGNHDEEETDLTSDGQFHLMQNLPYFIGETGPKSVDGHGNYVRSIRAHDSDTVLTTLYFLDSHVGPGFEDRFIPADSVGDAGKCQKLESMDEGRV